ncbi:proline dehydrogenase 1, mitochondrial-like [Brevipalpus obovatus]|uniref:proline dehydrogenase 1, mitochondrial-like n=1 Tax=Brevipalpus obovatus TaxID=246614 RepID=UPI003D9E6178
MNRFVKYAITNHRRLDPQSLLKTLGSLKNVESRASQSSVVTNDVKCRSDEPLVSETPSSSEIKFDNVRTIYGTKTMIELIRALVVLKMTSYHFLVANNVKIMEWCQSVLGEKLFRKLIKLTFFGHFIAGENHHEILPKIERLSKAGVRPIISHDLEEKNHDEFLCQNVNNIFKDQNVPINTSFRDWYYDFAMKSIETLKNVEGSPLIAIKLTSLCTSLILRKISAILEPVPGKKEENYQHLSISELLNREEAKFSSHEMETIEKSMILVNDIIRNATDSKIGVLVDAEHSYFQPAIHRMAMDMMRKHNRSHPFVSNTYQNYLKSANDTMLRHLNESKKFDFCFGAKLVRGAYMDSERSLAKKYNYSDPINESYEKTSEMIHRNLNVLMEEMDRLGRNSNKISILIASNNEDTARLGIKGLKSKRLNPESIAFAQLYAMSDHITFSLGEAGLHAYKWIAFGPIEKILPYLSRRAAENHSVLEKTQIERKMIRSEILRRLTFG